MESLNLSKEPNKYIKFLKENWFLILGILYLVLPVDLIPDVLIPVGYTDDIALLGFELIRRWFINRRKKL